MRSNVLTSSILAATASAAIVQIQVSQSGLNTVVYNPDSVTANVGDTVIFNFQNTGHNVVQSPGVDSACQPSSSGFYSGFQSPGQAFAINVTSTDPIWFYCSAANHCERGMAGVINPGSGATIADYKSKAATATTGSSSSADGTGGQLGSLSALEAAASAGNSNTAASSSSAASSSAASTAASSAATAASSSAAAVASSASQAMSSALASVSSLMSSVTMAVSSSAAAGASAASSSSSRASTAGAAATGVPVAMAALAGLAALL